MVTRVEMRTVGLFEAKQKLSELVERASEGEQIGITRRGKLAAIIIPVRPQKSLAEVFADIEEIRKRAKPLPKGITIKDLIEEGRR
jgi:prevent-host-death family protein